MGRKGRKKRIGSRKGESKRKRNQGSITVYEFLDLAIAELCLILLSFICKVCELIYNLS